MKNLLFIGYSSEVRTKQSGYEHIVDLKDDNYKTSYLDAKNLPFGFIPCGTRGKRLNLYFLEFIGHMKSKKYDLIHNFHCDQPAILKIPSKRKYKAVATTHLNYHEFSERQIKILKSYDAVICLNSAEERFLQDLCINAKFIPHGFNKPNFQFNRAILDNYKDKINICFSGVCYRDYETLEFFISQIQDKDYIQLHLLGQKKTEKERFSKFKNVKIYDFLSDDDYYSVLASCDYNFLPLTFATANNTLLEAQFLGVESILPNMEGLSDYASEKFNIFYSNKIELLGIIKHLRKNEKNLELESFSNKFLWNSIFKETIRLYNSLFKE